MPFFSRLGLLVLLSGKDFGVFLIVVSRLEIAVSVAWDLRGERVDFFVELTRAPSFVLNELGEIQSDNDCRADYIVVRLVLPSLLFFVALDFTIRNK